MKLTELAAKAQESGVEMNLNSVRTDSVGNILTAAVGTDSEPLRAILQEEGYLEERECASPMGEELTEYTARQEQLFSFLSEELSSAEERIKGGLTGAQAEAILLSCIGSLRYALQFTTEALCARMQWAEEDLLNLRKGRA